MEPGLQWRKQSSLLLEEKKKKLFTLQSKHRFLHDFFFPFLWVSG